MKLKKILWIGVTAGFIPWALCFRLSPSCAQTKSKIQIVTTLFPLYDFTRHIGGDLIEVSLLIPPGVEAHAYEPKLRDIFRINQADIFIYTGKYMEPWVEDILKGVDNKNLAVIDASKGVSLIGGEGDRAGFDPHIWLDFSNARIMVDNILAGLTGKDPLHQDSYKRNAQEYGQKLAELDEKFKQAFGACQRHIFIYGGHPAFGYFAKRYGLTYLSPYKSVSPDAEPTPKAIMELVEKLKENNLKYVYYEELLSPKLAETISRETGAGMLPLNGAHNVSKQDLDAGVTFLSLMEENLDNLKEGLACR
jgi:zinc transport system substrate-binding protein